MSQVVAILPLMALALNSGTYISSAQTRSESFNQLEQQRPRFTIPKGNLSVYKDPNWEILYFLKFGELPFTTLLSSTSIVRKPHIIERLKLVRQLLMNPSEDSSFSEFPGKSERMKRNEVESQKQRIFYVGQRKHKRFIN